MKISESFSSNYIRAADVAKPRTVIIASCSMETLGQGAEAEEKPVLAFRGAKKGMVLNKTNALQIAGMYGDDTDQWIGQPIELFSMKVQGPNGIVDGIRVRPAPGQAPAQVRAAEEQNNAVQQSQDFDDDIPF